MLGLFIGTVCAIAVVKMLRRGRGYGGFGRHSWYRDPTRGPRWLLRGFFQRLDTTPGQEKAIVLALEQLRGSRTAVREEIQRTREDLARAVAGGLIDDRTLEETFARHDRLLAQLRVAFVESLRIATEALDERQRKQASDLLEGRAWSWGPRWGGSYRAPGVWV
jgi:Spy/CpxP family protein refolding chaperone